MKQWLKYLIIFVLIIILILFLTQRTGILKTYKISKLLGIRMKPNIDNLIPHILKWEGGFNITPGDTGGATNKGVTIGVWANYAPVLFGFPGTVDTLKTITTPQMSTICKKLFWDKALADQMIDQRIANMIVDHYWGSGVYAFSRLHKVLKNKFGIVLNENTHKITPATIQAINSVNQDQLHDELYKERKQHYVDIANADSSQKKFLQGWLNRADSLYKYDNENF